MNARHPLISKLILFLCATFLIETSFAQSATLEGTVIKMPVVVVGTSQFSVDLSLILGSDPVMFSLAAAAETSGGDTTNAPFLEGAVLKIPTLVINGVDFFVDLTLTSNDPVLFTLSNFGPNPVVPTSAELRAQSLALFQQNVEQPIINSRCIACHVQGGIARNTGLVYQRQSASSTATNIGIFETFIQSRSNAVEFILSKASGTIGHVGGAQLSSSSADFANFNAFLALLASSLDSN
jgi:hypothetical protein